jgi:hypothetical protein
MSLQACAFPLVVHSQSDYFECTDSDCTLDRDSHSVHPPCQWSWPYAHGRVHAGQAFPRVRCSQCRHIRRAGHPDVDLAAEMQANG